MDSIFILHLDREKDKESDVIYMIGWCPILVH